MTAGFGYGRVCRVARPSSCAARTVGVLWASTSSAFQCGRACITLGPVLHREASRYCLFIFGPTGCVWEGLHHDLTALSFDIRQPTVSPCASVSLIPVLCFLSHREGSRCRFRSGGAHFHCAAPAYGSVRAFNLQNCHPCVVFATRTLRRVNLAAHGVMLQISPVFRRIGRF